MSDKPVAALVTAAVVAPLCAVCILGPAFLGSALAGATGWFGGLGPVVTGGLAMIAGIAVYGFVRRKGKGSLRKAGPAGTPVTGQRKKGQFG